MPKSAFLIDINPAVLRWARETAGRSVEEAAHKLGRSPKAVEDWEAGRKPPSWPDVRRLAAYYKRPAGALLLPEPPAEPDQPTDFRTHPGPRTGLSPKTRLAIRTARWLQGRAIELRQELKLPAEFQPARGDARRDPERLAANVRAALGIDLEQQRGWTTESAALQSWRNAVQQQGVLVFQFAVPTREVRGFSLYDPRLPVIALNQSDAVRARIFTLFHEYGHLLLGKPGICRPEETALTNGEAPNVETFCNRFAAAVLVPRAEAPRWGMVDVARTAEAKDRAFRELAQRYWVSKYVILGRLRAAGAVSDVAYGRISARWQGEAQKQTPRRGRPGGPRASQRSLQQRGKAFARLVADARRQGLVTTHDAMTYLGVKSLQDLRELESALNR